MRVWDVFQTAAHEAFDRDDGILRVGTLMRLCSIARFNLPIEGIAHDGREQRAAIFVAQHHAHAAAYRGDQRVGRAEINAYR